MVGKIKHVRQKIHQQAVKLDRPSSPSKPPDLVLPPRSEEPPDPELLTTNPPLLGTKTVKQTLAATSFPTGIFAGTRITPEALVQTLKFEEPPDVSTAAHKGPQEKKVKSKKEKMKERRERWLNKISSIKQAKEQQAAEARRQATPIVGDLRPLADALPELSQLIGPLATAATTAPAARRKSRKNKVPVKRPEPTDFSQMKQSQKRKLLETETSRFSDAIKTISVKANPLIDIGEQLRKRMRQEEERDPS